jgi:hypothetical protein
MSAHEHEQHGYQIQVDRAHYTVTQSEMTGAELRQVPTPAIGPDRDLFEIVPGHPDEKIADDQEIEMKSGLRFFTAPAHINPGSHN